MVERLYGIHNENRLVYLIWPGNLHFICFLNLATDTCQDTQHAFQKMDEDGKMTEQYCDKTNNKIIPVKITVIFLFLDQVIVTSCLE